LPSFGIPFLHALAMSSFPWKMGRHVTLWMPKSAQRPLHCCLRSDSRIGLQVAASSPVHMNAFVFRCAGLSMWPNWIGNRENMPSVAMSWLLTSFILRDGKLTSSMKTDQWLSLGERPQLMLDIMRAKQFWNDSEAQLEGSPIELHFTTILPTPTTPHCIRISNGLLRCLPSHHLGVTA
jgi:hypothetical protein